MMTGSTHALAPGGATVLYVSSNGAGMGHLTRLMAMATRAAPGVDARFLSMSQAVPLVDTSGFGYEYVPSRGDLGIGPRRWNRIFARRFAQVLRRERPSVVVFDGTYPYHGLFAARDVLPGVRLVWSRRGMWRPGVRSTQLLRSNEFDLVIEPGELAAELDHGPTADRSDALRVGPVTLLDPCDLVGRDEAARALGVDPAAPTALVTLGAGTINDLTSDLGRVVAGLCTVPDLQVVVARPVIARAGVDLGDRVRAVSLYPVSRYLAAVDLAVAASGYNAFHELVGFGVPTAFVPNTSTALDDQAARARWVHARGAGLYVDALDDAGVERIAAELGDPATRAAVSARAREVRLANGAGDAQAAVEQLVGGGTA